MLEQAFAQLGGFDPRLWVLAMVAGAALLIVIGVSGLIASRDPVEQRLARSSSPRGPGDRASLRRDTRDGALKRFSRYLTPADQRERTAMRERLARAGYRSGAAIRVYYLARAALGLGGAVTTALALPMLTTSISAPQMLVCTAVVALVGYFLPVYWVARRVQVREEQIRDGFPDTLDMLLVCLEAGQALDAALARVAIEVKRAHPVLAEELALVGHELRAGKERSGVLRDFARRAGVDDISAFVTVLIQSDQFGTSIADALRVYATEMRQKRLMRAEEQANKLPVKLALGTMAFTVPPVLLILIGPSIIMVMRSLARFMQ